MIAVVMCGGKGSRMDDSTVIEKPLQNGTRKDLDRVCCKRFGGLPDI